MSIKAKDKTDYPLRSIYFYPTESCNLKCSHCWIHPSYASDENSYQKHNQENVSVEVMEQVVRDAIPLGLSHIKFTGGEPFLSPKLFEYIEKFSSYGLSFSFETNGTLLTEDTVSRLKAYKIRAISLSLDGSTPEIHDKIRGVEGSFHRAIKGISILIENQIFPQVIFCLQRVNFSDLENTIRLAHKLGVRSFKVNPIIFFEGDGEGCEGLSIEELMRVGKQIENEFSDRYGNTHIDLYVPPALKGIKEFSRNTIFTCKIHTICGILSNGDVSICGIGRREKNLIMGNVREQGIDRIWKEGALFQEIREKVPAQLKGICGSCLFKYHCLGFCRAHVLCNGQSAMDPYGICEEVFEKGLFPKSRILSSKELGNNIL